jgi:DNA-binding XRE family transcriptional regulator
MPGTRGRPPKPETTGARRKAIELRTRGLTTIEIGELLGITPQGAWRLLSNYGRSAPAPITIVCCLCGKVITTGGDTLKNNGPVPCLDCLRQRPETPFAVRLKVFRLIAGWTQAELARRAQLSHATIRRYETGEAQVKWPNLVKLMRLLGTDLVTLGVAQDDHKAEPDRQARRERLPNKPR